MTEHDTDLPGILHALVKWLDPVDRDTPGSGLQNAGKHLNRGGFPRAVFPDKAHDLPITNGERDVVNGSFDGVFTGEQIPYSRKPTLFLYGDLELFF